jgi:VIT1/CCC1 family predicted Fe2+/Mn2+ transporter
MVTLVGCKPGDKVAKRGVQIQGRRTRSCLEVITCRTTVTHQAESCNPSPGADASRIRRNQTHDFMHASEREVEGTMDEAREVHRRFRTALWLFIGLALLGLIPLAWVSDRVAYAITWAAIVLTFLLVFFLAGLQLRARVTQRAARLAIYIGALLMAGALGLALFLLRH